MLRNIIKITIIIYFITLFIDANAQTEQSSNSIESKNKSQEITNNLVNGSLKVKFDKLLSKSGNFKTFKVIQKDSLLNFWNQTLDTLTSMRKTISSQNSTINQSLEEIEEKKEIIAKKDLEIEKSMQHLDLIEIFGVVMSKSNFKTISFILIFVLLCGLSYVLYLYKQSQVVTNEAVTMKEDVEKLLAIEKKKRSDDIHRLKRELQTEINLVNELKRELNS